MQAVYLLAILNSSKHSFLSERYRVLFARYLRGRKIFLQR